MSKREQIWNSLKDKEYRELFASDVGTGLAFQIKLLREERGFTQEKLAEVTGKAQETVSQLENPNYGRYSLATLTQLAGAFDVALVVRFAPFSELVDYTVELSSEKLAPLSFEQEDEKAQAKEAIFQLFRQRVAEFVYGFRDQLPRHTVATDDNPGDSSQSSGIIEAQSGRFSGAGDDYILVGGSPQYAITR